MSDPTEQQKKIATATEVVAMAGLALFVAAFLLAVLVLIWTFAVREWRQTFPPEPKEYPMCTTEGGLLLPKSSGWSSSQFNTPWIDGHPYLTITSRSAGIFSYGSLMLTTSTRTSTQLVPN